MDLKYVKGLSEKRIGELNKLGINSAEKLIRHFPRNYLDLTRVIPLEFCYANEYAFTKAKLISLPQTFTSTKRLGLLREFANRIMKFLALFGLINHTLFKNLKLAKNICFMVEFKRNTGRFLW